MMLYNSKCFFCNQEVRCKCDLVIEGVVSPEVLQLCDPHACGTPAMRKEPSSRGQIMGPGYSRILTAAKEQPDFEGIFKSQKPEDPRKKSRNSKGSYKGRTLVADAATAATRSNVKLAPIRTSGGSNNVSH